MSDESNHVKEHFQLFVGDMDTMLRQNEKIDGRSQRALLQDLWSAETRFKETLLSTKAGKDMYQKFVDFILKSGDETIDDMPEGFIPKSKEDHERFVQHVSQGGRNILKARPYFREKQETFSRRISKSFSNNQPQLLYKFRINYEFIKWVMERYTGAKKKQLERIFQSIIDIRKLLTTNNLPLAINRAHLFWSKSGNHHLEYMDLIQMSSEGLMTAIDKFVPPYKTVFRTTAIGRMTLNMSDSASAGLVQMPARDKRILYRARNAFKEGIVDPVKVLAYINETFKTVTLEELASIEAAAYSMASLHEKPEDGISLEERLEDTHENIENRSINRELGIKLRELVKMLSVIEQKIIKLKQGNIYDR